MAADLKIRLFDKLLNLDMSFHDHEVGFNKFVSLFLRNRESFPRV